MTPKVFVSHASEDKEHWARPLAEALRARGVDAWLDQWEMRPGDSLVNKIFNSGIREANAFVVVLSHTSITKPWVEAELNVAVVNNIEGLTRLIPVKVDDCAVPTALKDKFYVEVAKLGGIDAVAKEIADALFNVPKAPPVASPPTYTTSAVSASLPGLSPKEALVYDWIYRHHLDEAGDMMQLEATPGDILVDHGVSAEDLEEAVYLLVHDGWFVKRSDFLYMAHPGRLITYAAANGVDVDGLLCRVVQLILNGEVEAEDFHEHLAEKRLHVWAIIVLLESQNYFERDSSASQHIGFIYNVSPALRRFAREKCQ